MNHQPTGADLTPASPVAIPLAPISGVTLTRWWDDSPLPVLPQTLGPPEVSLEFGSPSSQVAVWFGEVHFMIGHDPFNGVTTDIVERGALGHLDDEERIALDEWCDEVWHRFDTALGSIASQIAANSAVMAVVRDTIRMS